MNEDTPKLWAECRSVRVCARRNRIRQLEKSAARLAALVKVGELNLADVEAKLLWAAEDAGLSTEKALQVIQAAIDAKLRES